MFAAANTTLHIILDVLLLADVLGLFLDVRLGLLLDVILDVLVCSGVPHHGLESTDRHLVHLAVAPITIENALLALGSELHGTTQFRQH